MSIIHFQPNDVLNLRQELDGITEHWQPKIINQHGFQFRLVKFQGEFEWHAHETSDKVIFVVDGKMQIDFKDSRQTQHLSAGQFFVIAKNIAQKPSAQEECSIVLIENRND